MRPSDSVDISEIIEPMSEAEFQAEVVKIARLMNWFCYHTWDSRRSEAGFPDLVLVHRAREETLFCELKTDTGKVTPAQRKWLEALRDAGQQGCVWRPRMMDEIVTYLTNRHTAKMPPGWRD